MNFLKLSCFKTKIDQISIPSAFDPNPNFSLNANAKSWTPAGASNQPSAQKSTFNNNASSFNPNSGMNAQAKPFVFTGGNFNPQPQP